MGKDIKNEFGKYKIKTKTKISDDGEKIILNLEFNDDLRKFLKHSCSDDKEKVEDIYDFNPDWKNKRYKIKTAVFKQMPYKQAGIIFNCNLLDKGLVEIEINDISTAEILLDYIRRNLKELIRFYYNLDEENTISFKLETTNGEDDD